MESEIGREHWKNASRGVAVIWTYDRRGEPKDQLVPSGKTFTLTRDERLLNMDAAASDDLDIFKNGTLVPVRLLEGTEDAREFASNPNLMTEDDMRALFGGHWKTFDAKVATVSNATTLQRMLDLAEDVNATMKQVKTLQNRIAEVSPEAPVEVTQTRIGPSGGAVAV